MPEDDFDIYGEAADAPMPEEQNEVRAYVHRAH
jgi:hypothetical protein